MDRLYLVRPYRVREKRARRALDRLMAVLRGRK